MLIYVIVYSQTVLYWVLIDASIKMAGAVMCSHSYLDNQLIFFNTKKQKEYSM